MAIWAHEDPVIVYLIIEGETVVTTPEHPFYTVEGEWVPAADLQPGVEIRSAEWGSGTVEKVGFSLRPQVMYNFTVAEAHTYFVGTKQWLIHSYCPLKLTSPQTFSRNGQNFLLEQGDSSYGWTHIWERHVRQGTGDILYAKRTKFSDTLSQTDIFNLLEQTLQNGTSGTYYDFVTYTYTLDGVTYRATTYLDGRIKTFHPLEP